MPDGTYRDKADRVRRVGSQTSENARCRRLKEIASRADLLKLVVETILGLIRLAIGVKVVVGF